MGRGDVPESDDPVPPPSAGNMQPVTMSYITHAAQDIMEQYAHEVVSITLPLIFSRILSNLALSTLVVARGDEDGSVPRAAPLPLA